MSQHFFSTTYQSTPTSIVLGWDRPMQCYFMEILQTNEDPLVDNIRYIYSYLHEKEPFNLTLDDFRHCLKQLDIAVPDSMFRETELDAIKDLGNRFVSHEMSGAVLEL